MENETVREREAGADSDAVGAMDAAKRGAGSANQGVFDRGKLEDLKNQYFATATLLEDAMEHVKALKNSQKQTLAAAKKIVGTNKTLSEILAIFKGTG